MCIIVREIKLEDVEGAADVIKTAGMGSGEGIRSWIENLKEGEHIFIAEKDGKIISFVSAILKQPPYGFIPTVATHSDYRRMGAATKTLEAVLAKAREAGFSIVGLFTGSNNIAGQGLYKKLGFVPANPHVAYLINPLKIPLVDELKAKRPFLEPKLEESLVKVEGIDCACLKWYDVISKEQIAFCFNPIHEWNQGNPIVAFNLMKLDIDSSSLNLDASIQAHASNFNLCQDSEASVGIIIENRSESEFEYKLKVELPSCLTTEDKLNEIEWKIAPRGKYSHNINVLVPKDAQIGIAPVYFKVNDMIPISATLWIRNMIEFNLTPKILTLAPGESNPISINLTGNHPEPNDVEYELAYPADFSLKPSGWKTSNFKQGNKLFFQQSVTAPLEAKYGSYELTGTVAYRNREFTSTIKLRITDFPRILLLTKDEGTEPLIDAILSEPANGLTWLTLQEVINLNWIDTLTRYNLVILDELQRPRPLSFEQMWSIRHCVKNGMGFLMFGGWESCQGHDAERCGLYKGTPIEDILPVEFSSEWDTYETEGFRVDKERTIEPFKLKCVDENHPITQGIDWESVSPITGYNKCASVKEKGKVLAVNEKTNHPILVIGEYGRGKVAVFLTCHGRGWASNLKEWSGFNRLWNNLIKSFSLTKL
jgi:uncharacterized membrane protein/ribosomal protein S18 acetylase RimI-like enzyme